MGVPVLLLLFLGSDLLLFGWWPSAYATAAALTSGAIPLVSIEIGPFLTGNVMAGRENVGKALAFGIIVVSRVVMARYVRVQRRASRWLR